MNIEQKDTGLLINEWQLGQQLNTAVHNGTREKFNLLLSFLSDDARDFGQFALQQEKQIDTKSGETNLRSAFSLPESQPLVNKGMSAAHAQTLNQNVKDENLSSIRLQLLLNNEALVSRSDTLLIDSEVSDNLTFLSQQRLTASLQSVTETANTPVETANSVNELTGVNAELMAQYQALDLQNKPIKVTYM